MAPKFAELMHAGGKVEDGNAAPRFSDLLKAGANSVPVSQEPGDLAMEEAPAQDSGDWKSAALGPLATYVGGALKGGADEMVGELAQKFGREGAHGLAPEPGKALKMPAGGVRFLKTGDDVYRAGRDFTRQSEEAFKKEHPYAHFGLSAAGDATSDFALAGGKALKGLYQGASGALTGLLSSDAELTDDMRSGDDMASAAGSTGAGGALGYILPAAGEGVSKWVGKSKLGQWLADKSRRAAGDAAEQTAMGLRKKAQQAIGSLGSEAREAISNFEAAQKIVADPHAPPELVARATEFVNSPETRKMLDRAYSNVVDASPHYMGQMALKEEAKATAQKAATPEAINAATDEMLSRPLEPVGKFLKNYGSRAIPAFVGSTIGGPAGGVIGSGVGAALGNPGTALRNMINNPALRKGAADATSMALTQAPRAATALPVALRYLQRKDQGDGLTPDERRKLEAWAEALRKDAP